MEDIRFSCPGCNQTIEAPAEMAGQTAACPDCGQQMVIPEPAREELTLNDIAIGEEETPPEPTIEDSSINDISFGKEDEPPISAADILNDAATTETAEEPATEEPVSETAQCPDCGAEMTAESVLCMTCGYHKTLGKKISTKLE